MKSSKGGGSYLGLFERDSTSMIEPAKCGKPPKSDSSYLPNYPIWFLPIEKLGLWEELKAVAELGFTSESIRCIFLPWKLRLIPVVATGVAFINFLTYYRRGVMRSVILIGDIWPPLYPCVSWLMFCTFSLGDPLNYIFPFLVLAGTLLCVTPFAFGDYRILTCSAFCFAAVVFIIPCWQLFYFAKYYRINFICL